MLLLSSHLFYLLLFFESIKILPFIITPHSRQHSHFSVLNRYANKRDDERERVEGEGREGGREGGREKGREGGREGRR